ncbi:HAD family hydrolase [Bradyrhizobium arachidis]|uniref:HAD family hydrolase n=1 Tax=Bradyrhizobium TaxID=374 RepID=UPI000A013C6A
MTNNLAEVQARQRESGGIGKFFERSFSADSVKVYKPSPQTYAHVENELGARPSQLCMIACQAWDTLGAVAAGCEAALIKRSGNDILGVGPQPQITSPMWSSSSSPVTQDDDDLLAAPTGATASLPVGQSRSESGTLRPLPGGCPA